MPIELLQNILQPLCSNIYQQGSAPAEYPARFFTFWNSDTPAKKHYDNGAFGYLWEFDIYFYSTDPLDIYSTMEQARTALLAAGWTVNGKGFAAMSDFPTHTGRGLHITYTEI